MSRLETVPCVGKSFPNFTYNIMHQGKALKFFHTTGNKTFRKKSLYSIDAYIAYAAKMLEMNTCSSVTTVA